MLRPTTRSRSVFAPFAGIRYSLFIALGMPVVATVFGACDPTELPPVGEVGPPFLIVAPSSQQPASVAGGTSLYIQARGGDHVGILTHGCTHTYGGLSDTETTSCAALGGSEPFTLLVYPTSATCTVEVRLYYLCDDASVWESVMPLGICDSQGMFVTSVEIPVAGISNGLDDAGLIDGAAGDDAANADVDAIAPGDTGVRGNDE